MQTLIPSVVSTLNALLKGPAWLLQKLIGIFAGWGESLSSHIPSSDSYSPSDSPYELRDAPSQGRVCHPHGQISVHSQYPKANRTPSQHSPNRKTSTLHPTQTASSAPRSTPVAKPVKSKQSPLPRHATVMAPEMIDPDENHEYLRHRARLEGDQMSQCFQQATKAFDRCEKKLANELSLKGQAHKANMVRLDKEASAKIFQENNQRCDPNTVDLHGLYVAEAKFYFEEAVQKVRDHGQPLRVIVGRGNHSDGNIPKIKPAIQALGRSLGMTVDVDPMNDGCLVVNFE